MFVGAVVVSGGAFFKKAFKDKRCFGLLMLVFFLLSALRAFTIGADTRAYSILFIEIGKTNGIFLFNAGRYEEGYVFCNKLLSLITNNPQVLIFISSAFIYLSFFLFFKRNSKNLFVVALLFFFCGLFKFSLSAIRQCIALGILMFGYEQLKHKKYFPFVLLAALAFFFHRSSIVFSLLMFLSNFKWKRNTYLLLFAISVTILFLSFVGVDRFILTLFDYSRYIGSIYDDGLNFASIVLALMCLVDIWAMYTMDKTIVNSLFFKMTVIKLCVLLISFRLNAVDRLADYLTFFEIVGLSNAFYKSKHKNKLLLISLVFAMYVSYSFVWGIMRPEYQFVWPYKFFWEESGAIL